MARLPEEILEYIIGYALPDKASIIRNGKGLGGHPEPFSHHRYVCELTCQANTSWTNDDGSNYLPLRRFKTIELHFHPEISFIGLQHDTRQVTRQMTDRMTDQNRTDGISTEAYKLAEAMKNLKIPSLVKKGLLDITIKFHEACPFHDPVSYANAQKPPPYYIPVWDIAHTWLVLERFRWMFQDIDTVANLQKPVTFPNIAWTASYSRGQFNGADFGPDFLRNLTLIDKWDGLDQSYDDLPDQAWTLFTDPRGSEYREDLRWWLARFHDMQYVPYNISPQGNVNKLQRDDIGMMVDVYDASAGEIAAFDPISTGSDELIHEWKLLESILSEMRQHLNSAISSLDQFQLLVANARMQAFQPILAEVLAEITFRINRLAETPTGEWSLSQTSNRINIHLLKLKSLGLWDGKWKGLDEGDHVGQGSRAHLVQIWERNQSCYQTHCGLERTTGC